MAENWVNRYVKIDFRVPASLRELMNLAEKYEQEDKELLYSDAADTIDMFCKGFVTDGVMTKQQWDTIVRRYPV